MEITREEGQLLAEFRKLPPHERQELIAVAKGLASLVYSSEAATASPGQCAIQPHPPGTTSDIDTLVTE